MAIFAWLTGFLGGLCAVMGIITATGVIPLVGAAFTAMFWLALAGVLFLACIAAALGRGGYE